MHGNFICHRCKTKGLSPLLQRLFLRVNYLPIFAVESDTKQRAYVVHNLIGFHHKGAKYFW
tara:strand:+ start:4510 stop:4692 length:183 start_codon:yes stop_codon:yes gene_type:complete